MSSRRISRDEQPIWNKAESNDQEIKAIKQSLQSILLTIASIQSDIEALDARITTLEGE